MNSEILKLKIEAQSVRDKLLARFESEIAPSLPDFEAMRKNYVDETSKYGITCIFIFILVFIFCYFDIALFGLVLSQFTYVTVFALIIWALALYFNDKLELCEKAYQTEIIKCLPEDFFDELEKAGYHSNSSNILAEIDTIYKNKKVFFGMMLKHVLPENRQIPWASPIVPPVVKLYKRKPPLFPIFLIATIAFPFVFAWAFDNSTLQVAFIYGVLYLCLSCIFYDNVFQRYKWMAVLISLSGVEHLIETNDKNYQKQMLTEEFFLLLEEIQKEIGSKEVILHFVDRNLYFLFPYLKKLSDRGEIMKKNGAKTFLAQYTANKATLLKLVYFFNERKSNDIGT